MCVLNKEIKDFFVVGSYRSQETQAAEEVAERAYPLCC